MARAADARVPERRQAVLLLKVLSYDYRLSRHGQKKVRLLVLFGASAASKAAASRMLSAFAALRGMTMQGMRVESRAAPYGSAAALDALARGGRVTAIYTAAGLSAEAVKAAARVARVHKLGTLSGVEWHAELGISVAVTLRGSLPQVWINPAAAKAQGSRFSARLMRIAKVKK